MKFSTLPQRRQVGRSARRRLSRGLRSGLLALALVAGSAGFGLVTAPAAVAVDPSKGSPGFCPNANGVTVVIDFQELGGTTIVRCAPGDQATGLTALKNAGIQIAGTNRWGESFICRIEGKPGPDSEPCIDTPPASAYWSYWHSPNAGNWTYSQWGVTNRKPPPGSFEGWSFSKDKTETTNPPPRVAPTRPAGDGSGGGTGGSSGGSSSGGNSGGTSGSSGGTGSSGASGGTSGGGADNGAPAPGDPKDRDADDASDKKAGDAPKDDDSTKDKDGGKDDKEPKTGDESSDKPLAGADKEPTEAAEWTGEGDDGIQPTAASKDLPMGTAAGIGAVALLVSAAGYTAWRRRQQPESGTGA